MYVERYSNLKLALITYWFQFEFFLSCLIQLFHRHKQICSLFPSHDRKLSIYTSQQTISVPLSKPSSLFNLLFSSADDLISCAISLAILQNGVTWSSSSDRCCSHFRSYPHLDHGFKRYNVSTRLYIDDFVRFGFL